MLKLGNKYIPKTNIRNINVFDLMNNTYYDKVNRGIFCVNLNILVDKITNNAKQLDQFPQLKSGETYKVIELERDAEMDLVGIKFEHLNSGKVFEFQTVPEYEFVEVKGD